MVLADRRMKGRARPDTLVTPETVEIILAEYPVGANVPLSQSHSVRSSGAPQARLARILANHLRADTAAPFSLYSAGVLDFACLDT